MVDVQTRTVELVLTKWLHYSIDVEVRRILSCSLQIRMMNGIYSCMFILYVKGQSEVIRLFSVKKRVSIG